MDLNEIFHNRKINQSHWIHFRDNQYEISFARPKNPEDNRETIARLYIACTLEAQKKGRKSDEANRYIRSLWTQEAPRFKSRSIPSVVGDDGFLRMYALGLPIGVDLFLRIWSHIQHNSETVMLEINPIEIGWGDSPFYDVDSTPPDLRAKLSYKWREKKDEELLQMINEDFHRICFEENRERRIWLTLAILSHAAVYRTLDSKVLRIPSFEETGLLVDYSCIQFLIAEGIKTVAMTPISHDEYPLYLCQGTELWPSQPSVLGSIIANFAEHGAATAAYAHSWRRIHKQLRDLSEQTKKLPIVGGHSMGGSLAIQIGLYSHGLIEKAYAFNPPMPNDRDYQFYQHMNKELQKKILITANLDDFAFWRIGSKVVGEVTIFLEKKRWRYYPIKLWEMALLIPAFFKFFLNVHHAFPAHQRIYALYENFVAVKLTRQEIERENQERIMRFDYLSFLPKLYDPLSALLRVIRKIFGWRLHAQYLEAEIEVIALHERDLIDTISDENKEEIEKQLQELNRQKENLIQQLKKYF